MAEGILALDLSKSSTGWAWWEPGMDRPRFGAWTLGTEFTSMGRVFCKLHECLLEHRMVMPFRALYHEEAIHPAMLQGHTNANAIKLAAGLDAHVASFGEAVGIPTAAVNNMSWRRDFIGRQKRGTKRATLKSLTIERCKQLGMNPRKDDEADAIGLLTYALEFHEHVQAPWTAHEVLRPPLGVAS